MDRYKFGEFIYQKRKALGLTQEELGRKLGVTNKAVSKWEVGETLPEVTMLEQLAFILHVSVDELLTQKEQQEKKTIKLNKLFITLTVILLVLNILSLTTFILYTSYMKNKEDPILLNEENFVKIIDMDEMTNFISDEQTQSIIITSKYSLNNNYYVKSEDEVSFVIEFIIEYYYYLDNDEIGMISYYARTEEIKFSENDKEEIKELRFSPINELKNFKSFKNVKVSYTILSYNGTVYKNK